MTISLTAPFTTPVLKAQNIRFGVQCQSSDYGDFCFGFIYKAPPLDSPLKPEIVRLFKTTFTEFDSSDLWPACPWWEHHRTWSEKTMSRILSGELVHDLKALIIKVAGVATGCGRLQL